MLNYFNRSNLTAILAGLTIALGGCASPSTDEPACEGGKCDDPGQLAGRECEKECGSKGGACVDECRAGKALDHCEARRDDAIASAQKAYTPDNVRWACSDVEGVNTNVRDDRGQEYCEYYAIVQAPPAQEGGALPAAVDLGRDGEASGITLADDQIFQLEDNADAVVGQCVFTSWHSDVDIRLPVCNGSDVSCPKASFAATAKLPPWQTGTEIKDIRLTSTYMQMTGSINSNSAASDLFEKCLVEPSAGDPADPKDPLHDPYIRGCMKTFELFQTEWRRSDPTVCAAGVRLAECGCAVDTNGDGEADITDPAEIARAIVPPQPGADGSLKLRGFHLGTWSDPNELPAGCRHIDTGDLDSTKTLVFCDLTASDVLASQSDVKQKCREKYGDNVVVHVPVPKAAVVCSPPAGGQYSASCPTQPWVIQ